MRPAQIVELQVLDLHHKEDVLQLLVLVFVLILVGRVENSENNVSGDGEKLQDEDDAGERVDV